MTPYQLHQTAAFIRQRYAPPDPRWTPAKYISHEAMQALADALDQTARAADVAARPSTEGDGGAPDEVHALLDFVWSRTTTTEDASGLVSLGGDAVLQEAESLLAEDGAELLRWEQHVLAVAQRVVATVRAQRS